MPSLYQEELECLRSKDAYAASHAPTFYSAHASLYRSRAKELPPLPRQRSDVNITNTYQETLSGENFMLHGDNNMLIFATPTNLQHLSAADTFCEGTFGMRPSIYINCTQSTVHDMVNNKMFPLVYGLLPDKKQSTYLSFNILKQKAEQLQLPLRPVNVTDFEAAKTCSNASSRGVCFTSDRRYGGTFNVVVSKHVSAPTQTFVKRASALPLVRPQDIDDVWMNALDSVNFDDPSIQQFADYVTVQVQVYRSHEEGAEPH